MYIYHKSGTLLRGSRKKKLSEQIQNHFWWVQDIFFTHHHSHSLDSPWSRQWARVYHVGCFSGGCWGQTPNEGKGTKWNWTEGEVKLPCRSNDRLSWPHRELWSQTGASTLSYIRAEMVQPLQIHLDKSLVVSHRRKGVTVGKELMRQGCLPIALPAAVATAGGGESGWLITVFTTTSSDVCAWHLIDN